MNKIFSVLFISTTLLLAGCSSNDKLVDTSLSDEEQIRETIDIVYSSVNTRECANIVKLSNKDFDEWWMSLLLMATPQFLEDKFFDSSCDYILGDDFADDLTYAIDELDVDGNKATAIVTVSSPEKEASRTKEIVFEKKWGYWKYDLGESGNIDF